MKIKTIKSSYSDINSLVRELKPIIDNEPVFTGTTNTSTASTTLSCILVSPNSFIGIMPSSTATVKTVGEQKFTVSHASSGTTLTFKYFVYG